MTWDRAIVAERLAKGLPGIIPHVPTGPQWAGLTLDAEELMYGGQAGGGKSDWLLMGALQYCDHPEYTSLLLRRTYADLELPGALMDRAHGWLKDTGSHYDARKKRWTMPSGATMTFGYLENERDKYRYQSAEFHTIGFDELTHFLESQYRYLNSRLRRSAGSPIPTRMMSATNPGGIGHEWVHAYFISPKTRLPGSAFIPARLADNPYVDYEDYHRRLNRLDRIEREQLLHGNWNVRTDGGVFLRKWWRPWPPRSQPKAKLPKFDFTVHSIDPAMSEKQGADYSASTAWGIFRLDRDDPKSVPMLMLRSGWHDKLSYPDLRRQIEVDWHDDKVDDILIEEKASGAPLISEFRRGRMPVTAFNPGSVDKVYRARLASIAFEQGLIWYDPDGSGVDEVIDECTSFPTAQYDDYVDSTSQMILRARRDGLLHYADDPVDEDPVDVEYKARHQHRRQSNWMPYG